MSHKRNFKKVVNILPPMYTSGRAGRVPCAGGCGNLVIKSSGECRKCRKARVRGGKRILAKLAKGNSHAKEED